MTFAESKKRADGSSIYAVIKVDIKWASMRFYNTAIDVARYSIVHDKCLILENGSSKFLNRIDHTNSAANMEFFTTLEEAECFKILELNEIEKKVDEHISDLRSKTLRKLKKLKEKEKLDEYIQKYPHHMLKVVGKV